MNASKNIQQAVILAGGLGTRLRPITERIPKPLVEVRGRPFLEWQLMDLQSQGITKILLLVAYLGELIQEYFKNHPMPGMDIEFSFEPEPLGTGGALRHAKPLLDEVFWLLNGDSFLRAPFVQMSDAFKKSNWDACVCTFNRLADVPVPANLKIKNNLIAEYKKGAGAPFEAVDAGVYILKKKVLENIQDEKFQLEQLWAPLIKNNKLGSFSVDEKFYDIGTPERLQQFEERLFDYFKNSLSH